MALPGNDPLMAKLIKETEEYSAIMQKIEAEIIPNLEGMQYMKTSSESQFTTFSVMGLVLIFFIMLAH